LVAVLQAAREIAPKISEIKLLTSSAAPVRTVEEPGGSNGNGVGRKDFKTMREFARGLGVSSIAERLAAMAYYAKVHDGKQTFTAKELDDWFTRCGFEKPAQMNVALSDAKRKAGTVESSSYGYYKITTSGENLIMRKIEEANEKQGE
jgi:hypothetical protein